jgi:hypothetical protein
VAGTAQANQHLNAVIIGFYRGGATIETICSILFMWPGEVEQVINAYFKNSFKEYSFSNN